MKAGKDPIIEPAPPSLAGLTWRPITPDDLAALVELAEECRLADGGIAFLNEPDNLKSRYFREGPGAAIGAFAADERLVACATVHLSREADAERAIIAGQVRPDAGNRGIGSYLMDWSRAQAQALFTTAPDDKRRLQIATESLTDSADRLYRAHGFEPVDVQLIMRRDLSRPLPDRRLPPGVTIQRWQPDLADQFFQAYQASFRERPGFPGWSAAEWIRWTDDDNLRPEWSLLAKADGAPLGFVTAGVEHVDSFVMQIGVIPGQRRRGLASALMAEMMRRMRAAGETTTELTVNLNNPGAIQTYARLGFETVGRRARYERLAER